MSQTNHELIVFAVRVKGTHKYLPRSQRRDERGGSWLEPIDFSNPEKWPVRYERNMMIRTFATESAAKNLLQSWLKGKYRSDGDGGGYLDKNTSREYMRQFMEIVPIRMVLPK